MKSLTAVFVDRPVFTWVLVLIAVVLGLNGLGKMPIERFPNVDLAYVSVTIAAPGLSAEQVESEISSRVEDALGTIGGLERMDSISSEGVGVVLAQFSLEKGQAEASNEVRDRVARLADELPPNAKPARIETFQINASPILLVALHSPSGARTPLELTELADTTIRRDVQAIRGVGDVRLVGGETRAFTITLDPLRLRAANLSAYEVQDALARENLEVPGGSLQDGEVTVGVRLAARARTADALRQVIVARQGDTAVRLGNLGEVSDDALPSRSFASLSGLPAVIIAITKQPGANTVSVVDAVRERLETARSFLPGGVELKVVQDNSEDVRASLHAVTEHLVLGAIFAAVVVLVFLRSWKATIVAGLAIPASLIGTFAVAQALGISLNLLSLLGLTLAVGIVIDDAIVVVENIARLLATNPRLGSRDASIEAIREIGLAVLATTLSLVAVFLPVATMDGIVGRYLAPFGLTMSASILISMGVAFTLTPMLSSRWLVRQKAAATPEGAGGSEPTRGGHGHGEAHGALEKGYGRAVAWVLRHRKITAVAIALTLFSVVPILVLLPTTFVPIEDTARFVTYVRLPEGSSIERTAQVSEEIAARLRAMPHVTETVVTTTSEREASIVSILSGNGFQAASIEAARNMLGGAYPSFLLMFGPTDDLTPAGPDGATIQYVVRGADLDELERVTSRLLEAAQQIPGTVDHGRSVSGRRPEIRVDVDRALASRMGVSQAEVGSALALLDREGALLGSMPSPDGAALRPLELRLRVGSAELGNMDLLRALTVRGAHGELIPLSALGELKSAEGPGVVRRVGRERQVTVFMNTLPGTSEMGVIAALEQSLHEIDPSGKYRGEVVGNAKEMEKAFDAFLVAIGLSFAFMYLVLAAQFESWAHPFTILMSLPLSLPFSLVALLVGGQSLNLFSMLGFLVLFGIVKKNSILQIDRIIQLRRAGVVRLKAIVDASMERLRPILMTTLAFVVGMIPLVVSSGPGAATNRSIAVGVLGGQTLSLALTLLVTPVLYMWVDDLGSWWKRRWGRAAGRVGEPALEAEGGTVG
jgi:HAE1 family hydrophobic/amphiphilic exporter-1